MSIDEAIGYALHDVRAARVAAQLRPGEQAAANVTLYEQVLDELLDDRQARYR